MHTHEHYKMAAGAHNLSFYYLFYFWKHHIGEWEIYCGAISITEFIIRFINVTRKSKSRGVRESIVDIRREMLATNTAQFECISLKIDDWENDCCHVHVIDVLLWDGLWEMMIHHTTIDGERDGFNSHTNSIFDLLATTRCTPIPRVGGWGWETRRVRLGSKCTCWGGGSNDLYAL